jgi:hypothetical protein
MRLHAPLVRPQPLRVVAREHRVREHRHQRVGIAPSGGRALLEQPLGRVLQPERHRGEPRRPHRLDGGERLVLLLGQQREEPGALPRLAAGEHLPGDEAQAVQIGAAVDGGAVHLLGRHVGRRAECRARLREARVLLVAAGDPEVREQGAIGLRVEEDVLRLHVAVHDAARVHGGQRGGDVAQHALGALRWEGALLANDVLERAPAHELHDEGEPALAQPPDRMDGDDVRVVELGDRPRLASQARHHLERLRGLALRRRRAVAGVESPRSLGAHDLDGHLAAERAVAGAVDDRVAPTPQLAQHLVLVLEVGHGRRVERVGRGDGGRIDAIDAVRRRRERGIVAHALVLLVARRRVPTRRSIRGHEEVRPCCDGCAPGHVLVVPARARPGPPGTGWKLRARPTSTATCSRPACALAHIRGGPAAVRGTRRDRRGRHPFAPPPS